LSKQRNGFNEENIGKIIKGSVFSVNPAISPGGRTIKVKIRTTTKSKNIQDGMFVTTWISAEKKENTLVIPYDSLVYQKNDTFVYVADVNEAIAQLKRIKTGLQGFNAVEVLEGISENDLVITKGRFQISEGTKIKIIELD
jgi:multidrug efflux pump subunit AcrA (membrane-fusion protein)